METTSRRQLLTSAVAGGMALSCPSVVSKKEFFPLPVIIETLDHEFKNLQTKVIYEC